MPGDHIRTRFSAMAAKVETTPGVDAIAGSPVLADFVLGSGSHTLNPQTIQDSSFSGGLDTLPGMVGAFMPQITAQVPLRGAGTVGVAPAFGTLLKACAFEEVVDAVGLAAAALTAGTTTTGTLGAGASATAQIYRGIPAILAVNPVGGAISPIMNYTTGKLATFGETFASVLTTATTLAIPANVLYRPTSDETVMKTLTLYLYEDGLLTIFTGCRGDVKLDLTSGNSGMLTFNMRGKFGGVSAASLPTALTAGSAQSLPIWTNGRARFGGDVMRCRAMSFAMNNGLVLPDNPESSDGYDAAVIMNRGVTTTLDPRADTSKQVQLLADFKAGTSKSLFAVLGAAPGNRFAISQPAIRQLAGDPGERDGLRTNQISAQANLVDAPLFLCAF